MTAERKIVVTTAPGDPYDLLPRMFTLLFSSPTILTPVPHGEEGTVRITRSLNAVFGRSAIKLSETLELGPPVNAGTEIYKHGERVYP